MYLCVAFDFCLNHVDRFVMLRLISSKRLELGLQFSRSFQFCVFLASGRNHTFMESIHYYKDSFQMNGSMENL